MPTEACQVSIDGLGGDTQVPADLAVGHAADILHEHQPIDVGSFLPVGGGESLSTEGAPAVFACKALDTPGVGEGGVEAGFLEIAARRELLVAFALGAGAVGWQPV